MAIFSFLFTESSIKNKKTGRSEKKMYLQGWVIALITMFISVGTWNPSGYDFVHYFMDKDFTHFFTYLEAFIVFLIWALSFLALYKSVGKWGIAAMIILVGLFFGGIVQNGWLDLWSGGQVGWFANISLGIMLWFGIMAPRFIRRVTGQQVTNLTSGTTVEVDNDRDGNGGEK